MYDGNDHENKYKVEHSKCSSFNGHDSDVVSNSRQHSTILWAYCAFFPLRIGKLLPVYLL